MVDFQCHRYTACCHLRLSIWWVWCIRTGWCTTSYEKKEYLHQAGINHCCDKSFIHYCLVAVIPKRALAPPGSQSTLLFQLSSIDVSVPPLNPHALTLGESIAGKVLCDVTYWDFFFHIGLSSVSSETEEKLKDTPHTVEDTDMESKSFNEGDTYPTASQKNSISAGNSRKPNRESQETNH